MFSERWLLEAQLKKECCFQDIWWKEEFKAIDLKVTLYLFYVLLLYLINLIFDFFV